GPSSAVLLPGHSGHLLWRRNRSRRQQGPGQPACHGMGCEPLEPGAETVCQAACDDASIVETAAIRRLADGPCGRPEWRLRVPETLRDRVCDARNPQWRSEGVAIH